MAFEPPPTQAQTASGRAPKRSSIWARDSLEMIDWKALTIRGNGAGPEAVPMR